MERSILKCYVVLLLKYTIIMNWFSMEAMADDYQKCQRLWDHCVRELKNVRGEGDKWCSWSCVCATLVLV